VSRMRDLSLIEKRRRRVKRAVEKSTDTSKTVRKWADKLCVSESTIWKDLAS
jgi:hypothetical protein